MIFTGGFNWIGKTECLIKTKENECSFKEMKDVKHLAHYANNPNIARFLTDGFPHPYSEEDARTFIRLALEKAGFRLEARLEKTYFKNGEFTDELIYAKRKE